MLVVSEALQDDLGFVDEMLQLTADLELKRVKNDGKNYVCVRRVQPVRSSSSSSRVCVCMRACVHVCGLAHARSSTVWNPRPPQQLVSRQCALGWVRFSVCVPLHWGAEEVATYHPTSCETWTWVPRPKAMRIRWRHGARSARKRPKRLSPCLLQC